MDDKPAAHAQDDEPKFAREVGTKAARKLRVLRGGQRSIWFGLGMSGLIGWSVTVPTLIGALAGFWWDRGHPGSHSWTLALLSLGLVCGCANAWHWIAQEDRAMHEDEGGPDE